MTDFSKLSNDELIALYNKQKAAPIDPTQMSDDELVNAYKQHQSQATASQAQNAPYWAVDAAKAFPAGVARGVTGLAGLPGDIQTGMKALQNWGQRKVGLPETNITPTLPFFPVNQQMPTSADTLQATESVTGPLYKPQTRVGRYSETLGEFVPGVIGPGGPLRKVVGGVVLPALTAQTAYEVAPEPYKNIAKIAGGITGGMVGSLSVPKFGPKARADQVIIDALTPDSQTKLNKLGPEAFLFESNPTTTQIAQGVTQRPSPASDALRKAVTDRHEAALLRLADDVRRNFGPPVSPVRVDQRISQAQRDLSVPYRAALHQSQPAEVDGILQALTADISKQAGDPKSALQSIRSFFYDGQRTKNTAGELLAIRQAIDDLHKTPKFQAQANTLRVISEYRQAVDDALRQAAPMVKGVDAKFEALARQRDALNLGKNILATGKEAVRPSQLAQDITKMSPAEQAALRLGARGEIDRVMGTSVFDVNALRNTVKSEGKWNHEKLVQIFGKAEADNVIGAVDREVAFRSAYDRLIANSQTAPRLRAEELTRAQGPLNITPEIAAGAAGAIITGFPGAAAPAMAATASTRYLWNRMAAGGQKRLDKAIVERLGLQGAERDAEIVRLLTLGSAKPKTPARDAIIRALIGGTLAH